MKGVIMAGGFGTRLRPLTNNLPKPMVPVANKPMMEYTIELLKKEGIEDIISLLFFHPEVIENYFGDGTDFGVKMSYIGAADDLGTAGSVKNAMDSLNETFLVTSGDVMMDFDLSLAIDFHKDRKALATMVLTRVENPLPFGIVLTDKEGKITRFLEKPGWGEVFSDTINTGIYILEPEVLNSIPSKTEFDFGKDLFPLLLQDKTPLYGYVADGYWRDVGNLREYLQVNLDILQGKIKVNIPGEKVMEKAIWVGKDSRVDFTANLRDPLVIGKNCRVGNGAKISNSIIGNNCVIEDGANIMDSILWDNVHIGKETILQENIVGRNAVIKDLAFLAEGAIISDQCTIGKGCRVKANVKVWPQKVVEDGATLSSSLVWGEKWSKSIFGTYGVTGLVNIEISPEFASKLGAAYGASLRKGAVVSVSRDCHKTSRMINRAIMAGMLSTGVNVHYYGVTPLPVARFLARTGDEVGGIHIRKSPFDPEIMDIKFFDDKGMDLHPSREKTIERLFYREDFRRVQMDETGVLDFPVQGLEYYRDGFMSFIDVEAIKKARFKLVIDYSYGSATSIFPDILGRLGCDVVAINANLDEKKLTKAPGDFKKSLEQLSNIVRSLRYDIGVMLDAGGEKVFFVDESGEVINGNIIDENTALNLIVLLVLKCFPKSTLAVPVTASGIVDEMAKTYGFSVKRTKISARSMMETALEKDVVFVGEETGGFIFPQFQPAFDGMFAIVKILEMMAKANTKFHKLVREIPQSFKIEKTVPCPWELKGKIMRGLIEDAQDEDVQLLDGIKIFKKDEWVIAYPSQDNAYFHVIGESPTRDKALILVNKYVEKIKSWQAR